MWSPVPHKPVKEREQKAQKFKVIVRCSASLKLAWTKGVLVPAPVPLAKHIATSSSPVVAGSWQYLTCHLKSKDMEMTRNYSRKLFILEKKMDISKGNTEDKNASNSGNNMLQGNENFKNYD